MNAQDATSPEPSTYQHIPVLLNEVLEALLPEGATNVDKLWVDVTCGLGGHSSALLEQLNGQGHLLALDRDPEAQAMARQRFESAGFSNVTLVNRPFAELNLALEDSKLETISGGLLADLGVSSLQLDKDERGFSFRKAAPLDMRMNPEQGESVAEWLETIEECALIDTIKRYGEDRLAKPLAQAIVAKRADSSPKNWTTLDLASIAEKTYQRFGFWPPKKGGNQKVIHPATRLFQALRMAVNEELQQLETLLESLPNLTASGARIAIISFHSLEDRLVKQWFKTACSECVCPPRYPVCQCQHQASFKAVTRKPLVPTEAEQAVNPRSRSAKLRVYERL